MPLGVDFRGFLTDSVARCHALIVVIGRPRQTSSDSTAGSNSARDYKRMELEAAIQNGIP